jgi:hypothetical protein
MCPFVQQRVYGSELRQLPVYFNVEAFYLSFVVQVSHTTTAQLLFVQAADYDLGRLGQGTMLAQS